MAFVLDDRVKETSTTIGTASYVLLGAVAGFQSFATVGNGNTTWYMATDGTDWEVGIGTYTAAGTLLARTTIISSSNSDAAVSWGAGTRTIVCTMPSSMAFVGPASSTDNYLARFDGTTGKTIQTSQAKIADTGETTVWGSDPGYDTWRGAADSNGGYYRGRKTRNSDPLSHTVVAVDDTLLDIEGYGSDGDQFVVAGRVKFAVDGTPGDNDMPGRITFSTTADGASSTTERLRITSTGRLKSSTGQVAHFWVYWTANSTTILASHNMDSIADTATGDADGTITTDFSDANWAGFVDTNTAANGWDAQECQSSGFDARAAGTFGVLCATITDGTTAVTSLTDPDQWQVVGFGVSA